MEYDMTYKEFLQSFQTRTFAIQTLDPSMGCRCRAVSHFHDFLSTAKDRRS